MRRGQPLAGLWVGLALCAALAAPAGVQAVQAAEPDGVATEAELLRDAGILEAEGDLAGAEGLLRGILERRPASAPALLALERVFRVERRLEEIVPLTVAALEEDPRSGLLNQLLVRTYSELDQVRELEAAGERWIAEVPGVEIPYRELAEIWEERGELDRALEVLAEGRDRIGREDALALEIGDLHAEAGALDSAVREWELAVGEDARGLGQVRRRLRDLPDGGAGVLPALVDLLTTEPSSRPRLEGAVDLAVEAGLSERAEAIAAELLPRIPMDERAGFLIDVARKADGGGLDRLAFWAYGELADSEDEAGRLLAIRNRLAELALELGDTATATANYRAVEAAYEQGTPQRRQAAALRIELMAGQDLDAAMEALREFRAEYAEAAELDELGTAVATGLVGQGRSEEAESLLTGIRGPRSSMLRGRIALERGSVEEARMAFMAAAPALRGGEATRVLGLVTLLGRVTDGSGRLLGTALRLVDEGEPGAAVDRVEEGLARQSAEDRPALLEFAAGLADRAGLEDDARQAWRHLLAEYPRAEEAPTALLGLARSLRAEAGGRPEARELLERLILEYPTSALVPQARRELQQITRAEAENR